MLEQFANWIKDLVSSMGYPGLFLLITLESTLVPVPSAILMPLAGAMASKGVFSLPVVLVINSTAALFGSTISYYVGAKGGKAFLDRYGKYFLIKPADIEKTERAFATHGKWVILIARFLPVVRHVISVPAGIARMPLRSFWLQTFLGSTIWGGFLIILGYQLGENWEAVAAKLKRMDLVIGVVIVLALLALAIRFFMRRRKERQGTTTNPE